VGVRVTEIDEKKFLEEKIRVSLGGKIYQNSVGNDGHGTTKIGRGVMKEEWRVNGGETDGVRNSSSKPATCKPRGGHNKREQ